MEQFKEFYLSLPATEQVKLADFMLKKSMGVHTDTYPACDGCEPTTPYGACYSVNGSCVWIPEFGQ